MLEIKKVEFPLQRLISIGSKFSYNLTVKEPNGTQKKLLCEFQTHSEIVFNGSHKMYKTGTVLDVRVKLLAGYSWNRCQLMYIEENKGFSLYQFAIVKAL